MSESEKNCGVMNPFVDWGFKYLFGTERSKKNLLGFLNLLLELDDPIVDLRYLNNESIPLDKDGRECIFDILCEDGQGEKYLIEVQNAGIGYMFSIWRNLKGTIRYETGLIMAAKNAKLPSDGISIGIYWNL